jgi:hypothetical protein
VYRAYKYKWHILYKAYKFEWNILYRVYKYIVQSIQAKKQNQKLKFTDLRGLAALLHI